ncbi:BtrH N-terminal domain-containing protein [uncultured Thermomonospora sp.]|uniref:BtrH N-terminal domain-containing protein n=1 Tax=uncultured Thermomonospora sp. TaxID=671175 RepID=UPI00259BD0BE|nr:BtrH N-terminal domain-containing protein [uncultured Thermomonospora sp.]
MAPVMIRDYPHRLGGHCGSGALRDLIEWAGLGWGGPPSEALVFGLGGGLSFHLMHLPGMTPSFYLGGRSADLELDLCRRLGIAVEKRQTGDPAEAWSWVTAELDAGRPVMVWADIIHLPYLRVRLSNSRHDLVVVGYDEQAGIAYVADNDREDIQQVPLDALAKARDSRGFPGPNRHATFPMRFPEKLPDLLPVAREAAACSAANLRDGRDGLHGLLPGRVGYTGGLEGIERFAAEIARWPDELDPDALSGAYRALRVFIEKAGTGGGLFRRLQAGFCHEVAERTGETSFQVAAEAYDACAETWSRLAAAATAPEPDREEIAKIASDLPVLEERAARALAVAGQG